MAEQKIKLQSNLVKTINNLKKGDIILIRQWNEINVVGFFIKKYLSTLNKRLMIKINRSDFQNNVEEFVYFNDKFNFSEIKSIKVLRER